MYGDKTDLVILILLEFESLNLALCNLVLIPNCDYAHKWLIFHKPSKLCTNKKIWVQVGTIKIHRKIVVFLESNYEINQHSTKDSKLHSSILWITSNLINFLGLWFTIHCM